MDVIHDRPTATPRPDCSGPLRALLLVPGSTLRQLPRPSELASAATALARGTRNKALLPLEGAPLEFALVRHGARVLVSAYDTSSAPEVHQLDHAVALESLLQLSARATLEEAQYETEPTARQIAVRLAERALKTKVRAPSSPSLEAVTETRGAQRADDDVALAFGFECAIQPSSAATSRAARADVHAMLFGGRLWTFVRGRRLELVRGRGPIMLPVQRMVVAARALLDAWQAGRPTSLRLRSGSFGIELRLDTHEEVAVRFRSGAGEVAAAALTVPEVVLPILAVASEATRVLVAVDRSQSRNLRVSALRDEVRALRRQLRDHRVDDGFLNDDPERVPVAIEAPAPEPEPAPPPRGLRFEERWRIALSDLDASAVYFCGDRLLLSSTRHTVAVDRGSGDVLWAREGASTNLMAGSFLLRLGDAGDIEICDVADGEPHATAQITPRVGGPDQSVVSVGEGGPPTAILAEGVAQLVAIDLFTGLPRWRFHSRRQTPLHLARAGRILIVASEGAVHALDVTTGEDVWRYAARTRFATRPTIVGDVVVALGAHGALHGIDLVTGRARWKRRVQAATGLAPAACRGTVVLVERDDQILGVDARTGEEAWRLRDPGLGAGACLAIDDLLVVNAAGGVVSGVDVEAGELRWNRPLGDPFGDEVPRELEPVLRSGALFVPADTVHVLRPADGELLGELPCDLVPDRVRVDERGWVYVAEESGHLAAYGPTPSLRLIRGGG